MNGEALLRSVLATTGAVAAAEDLDGALRALLAGVQELTGATQGSVRLPIDGPVGPCRVYRRWSDQRFSWHDSENLPDTATVRVLLSGRSAYVSDNAEVAASGDVGARKAMNDWGTRSSLIVPLRVGNHTIGSLHANSTEPGAFDEAQLLPLQILGDHAGAVVEAARRLDDARRARDELAAVIDATEDRINVYDVSGRLVHANRTARERHLARFGRVPGSIQEYQQLLSDSQPAGVRPPHLVAEEALAGRSVAEVQEVVGPQGPEKLHVATAPIRDEAGVVRGAVVVSRDITDLDRAIADRARLDGAIKTVRLVAHQLNGKLALVVGSADLLPPLLSPARELVDDIVAAANDAAAILERLQRIVRFEETEVAGFKVLDLDAATSLPG